MTAVVPGRFTHSQPEDGETQHHHPAPPPAHSTDASDTGVTHFALVCPTPLFPTQEGYSQGGGYFFDVSSLMHSPEQSHPECTPSPRVHAALVCLRDKHGAPAALSADVEAIQNTQGWIRTRALMAGPIWPTPMPPICTQNMTVMTRPPLMGHLVVSGRTPSPKHSPPSNCSASRCLRGCRRNQPSGVHFSRTETVHYPCLASCCKWPFVVFLLVFLLVGVGWPSVD